MMSEQFANVVRLSDVVPQQVCWLWKRRIPLGALTVLEGDPSQGKSVILGGEIAARVSRGLEMPDGTASDIEGQAGILLIANEDALASTVRPRFDAAGGDTSQVVVFTGNGNNDLPPAIPDDIDAIEQMVEEFGVKLIVIDSLMATFSASINSHRDQDVRRALSPLNRMAERTNTAVVVIRHLNKSGGEHSMYRGGGSIGIIGVSRSALVVALDPEDFSGERHILASVKSNLAKAPKSLAYRLVGTQVGAVGTVRVEWLGEVEYTADELLASATDQGSRARARSKAKSFLLDLLKAGPVSAKEVQHQANLHEHSWTTIRRASEALGVKKEKERGVTHGEYYWSFRTTEQSKASTSSNKGDPSHIPEQSEQAEQHELG